jgi:uncharacterized integral membrane protein
MTDAEKLPIDDPVAKRRRAGGYAKLIGALVVLALLVAWILANNQTVEVDWLVTETDGPLSVLLLLAAAAGAIIGAVLAIVIRRRSRRS